MTKRPSIQAPRQTPRSRLQERYDRLWLATIDDIRSGNIEIDPVLATGLLDSRRGLTVMARPSPNVRQRVANFLSRLRRLEPEQYYYSPSEFHITVLSLFTATVEYERLLARADEYAAVVNSIFRKVAPIQIEFTGITASRSAIMIQGFCETEALNNVRDALRKELRRRRLAEGVDQRYRLETAHMTVARFRVPLRDSGRLAAMLERGRRIPFGAANITRVNLVKNDWYQSRRTIETLKEYRLH
jgi:2'-5' RNA ligase